MKKKFFLIFFLSLWSIVAFAQTKHFEICYTDVWGMRQKPTVATLEEAFSEDNLYGIEDPDDEEDDDFGRFVTINLLADYKNSDGTPVNITINKPYKYTLNLRGYEMQVNVNFTIDGGTLTIKGDNSKTYINGTFSVKTNQEQESELIINGGSYSGVSGKPCILVDAPTTSGKESYVQIESGRFSGTILNNNPGNKLIKSDYKGFNENDEVVLETYNTKNEFILPKGFYVKDLHPFNLTYNYKNLSDDDDEESADLNYSTLLEAVDRINYVADYNELSDIKITLINDCIIDETDTKVLYFSSGNDVFINLKTDNKIQGGKYVFSASLGGKITIQGDNTNTNINATFEVGEGSEIIIDGGNYTNENYIFAITDENDDIIIRSGRFKSINTPVVYRYDDGATLGLASKRNIYEITYDANGKEIETSIDQDYNSDGYLVNGSVNVVKEFVVHKPITAYAERSADGTTLTFKYDGYMPDENAWVVQEDVHLYSEWSESYNHPENIDTVIFHTSFRNYRPISCRYWFQNFEKITGIDFENLITDESLLNMEGMFAYCEKLVSVDLSSFNTTNVVEMKGMFQGCKNLSKVTFGDNFSTEKVPDFQNMFYDCSSITEIDLSSFNTQRVETMQAMFCNCSKLRVIKLGSNFKLLNECDLNYFVLNRSKLETILVEHEDQDKEWTFFGDYLFQGCDTLRGGNGTLCDEEHYNDKTYFRIDRKDTPGFLTTLPYTFKCVDDNGIAFRDSFYYPSNKDISFFENNVSKVITLSEPEARKGYAFIGWSDSLNIDYSKDKIVKSVAFSTDTARCNRIYKANYKKRITAEVANKASYPDPERLELFCNGKESTIALPYKITYGNDNVIRFELHINNDEYVIADRITDDDTLFINNVPNIPTGVYDAELVFIGNFDLENNPEGVPDSDPYPITLTVNNVHNAAVQLYTDMLIADNHSGVYSAYQWYRDGEPIQGANEQYYVDKFDYNKSYSVKLSGNGEDIMSCPVRWLSTAKNLSPSVKVYPNPAKENELFTLEILDYDSEQSYDIVIFTANGTLVKKISNVEKQTSVSLPTGIYSGSLISGDDKKGFKIIVK